MKMVQIMVMPFRRGSYAKRPINSIKHVVDVEGGLVAATDSTSTFVNAVDGPQTPFDPVDVPFGGYVRSFYLSIFIIGATGAPIDGSINWYIAKQRSGQGAADFPTPSATGTSEVRNQIIHEEKGLSGSGDGTPMVFKGVIVIPKSMQRIRAGDAMFLRLRINGTIDATFCIKIIYKEYR